MIKNILVAIALTISKYLTPNRGREWEDATEQGEVIPERDEWQRMMHHDDVTPEERALLDSDDPADIKKARDQIFERQAEFQEWWDDKETKRKDFYGNEWADIEKGVRVLPIEQHEGWEDDNDMPEYYETVWDQGPWMKGKVVKVPYELDEVLNVTLGVGKSADDQYKFMFNYLVEVYTHHGKLTDEDYELAEYLYWESLEQVNE